MKCDVQHASPSHSRLGRTCWNHTTSTPKVGISMCLNLRITTTVNQENEKEVSWRQTPSVSNALINGRLIVQDFPGRLFFSPSLVCCTSSGLFYTKLLSNTVTSSFTVFAGDSATTSSALPPSCCFSWILGGLARAFRFSASFNCR